MGCEGKGGVQADSQVPVQGRGLCDEDAILKVGNVGIGSGVGERCWLRHVPFKEGPVTHLGRDVKKAAQCGS